MRILLDEDVDRRLRRFFDSAFDVVTVTEQGLPRPRMTVQPTRANPSHRSLLARLLQLYYYDLSEFTKDDVDEVGEYGPGKLAWSLDDESNYPYVRQRDEEVSFGSGCYKHRTPLSAERFRR